MASRRQLRFPSNLESPTTVAIAGPTARMPHCRPCNRRCDWPSSFPSMAEYQLKGTIFRAHIKVLKDGGKLAAVLPHLSPEAAKLAIELPLASEFAAILQNFDVGPKDG